PSQANYVCHRTGGATVAMGCCLVCLDPGLFIEYETSAEENSVHQHGHYCWSRSSPSGSQSAFPDLCQAASSQHFTTLSWLSSSSRERHFSWCTLARVLLMLRREFRWHWAWCFPWLYLWECE